jgi:hypothetical protein
VVRKKRLGAQARVSFNESQLEICVESLKDSGLEHLRGRYAGGFSEPVS